MSGNYGTADYSIVINNIEYTGEDIERLQDMEISKMEAKRAKWFATSQAYEILYETTGDRVYYEIAYKFFDKWAALGPKISNIADMDYVDFLIWYAFRKH